jgi:hypothetical protein
MRHNPRLVITRSLLTQALRALERTNRQWVACGVETSRRQDGVDWLGRPLLSEWNPSQSALLISRTPALGIVAQSPVAVLCLRRGEVPRAYLLLPDGEQMPMSLRLIAPGLPELGAGTLPEPFPDAERWSRTAGALGEHAWQRLCQLHYLLVGCGRNGSLLAHALVRMGARRLSLIDPDTVELANLDGDGYLPDHLGAPKAEALAESLRAVNPTVVVQPLAYSVSDHRILPAAREADVLITAVDDDGARWAVAQLAVLYLKPLLDVGTGVLTSESGEPLLGADIRWIVPGEGCLLCIGGLANPQQVEVVRQGLHAEQQYRAQRHWQQERRGSLRSLNMVAVGLALRMLEDYLATRLQTSRWLRLVYQDATPQVQEIGHGTPHHRCLCAYAGGGDRGLAQMGESHSQISHYKPFTPNPTVEVKK